MRGDSSSVVLGGARRPYTTRESPLNAELSYTKNQAVRSVANKGIRGEGGRRGRRKAHEMCCTNIHLESIEWYATSTPYRGCAARVHCAVPTSPAENLPSIIIALSQFVDSVMQIIWGGDDPQLPVATPCVIEPSQETVFISTHPQIGALFRRVGKEVQHVEMGPGANGFPLFPVVLGGRVGGFDQATVLLLLVTLLPLVKLLLGLHQIRIVVPIILHGSTKDAKEADGAKPQTSGATRILSLNCRSTQNQRSTKHNRPVPPPPPQTTPTTPQNLPPPPPPRSDHTAPPPPPAELPTHYMHTPTNHRH